MTNSKNPFRHFLRATLVLAGLGLAVLSGCGGGAFGPPTAAHPAQMTESDRYAAALYEAYIAYEQEVDEAARFTYPTLEAAREAAIAVSPTRFDALLAEALGRRGMTLTGLRVHSARHAAFLAQQRATYRPRLAQLRQRVVAIANQVPAQESFAVTLLEQDGDIQLASR